MFGVVVRAVARVRAALRFRFGIGASVSVSWVSTLARVVGEFSEALS